MAAEDPAISLERQLAALSLRNSTYWSRFATGEPDRHAAESELYFNILESYFPLEVWREHQEQVKDEGAELRGNLNPPRDQDLYIYRPVIQFLLPHAQYAYIADGWHLRVALARTVFLQQSKLLFRGGPPEKVVCLGGGPGCDALGIAQIIYELFGEEKMFACEFVIVDFAAFEWV